MLAPDDPRHLITKKLADRLKSVEYRNRRRAHTMNKSLPRNQWVEIEVVDFVEIVVKWNGCCCLCQSEIDLILPGSDDDGLTLEHMVSLAQGGSHTARNIGPAHRRCNMHKAAKKDGPGAAKIKRRQGITGQKARKARAIAKGTYRGIKAPRVSVLSKTHPQYSKPSWKRK